MTFQSTFAYQALIGKKKKSNTHSIEQQCYDFAPGLLPSHQQHSVYGICGMSPVSSPCSGLSAMHMDIMPSIRSYTFHVLCRACADFRVLVWLLNIEGRTCFFSGAMFAHGWHGFPISFLALLHPVFSFQWFHP